MNAPAQRIHPTDFTTDIVLLERDLLTQPGVSLVDIEGARDYEISIEVSETNLRRYGLSFDEVFHW